MNLFVKRSNNFSLEQVNILLHTQNCTIIFILFSSTGLCNHIWGYGFTVLCCDFSRIDFALRSKWSSHCFLWHFLAIALSEPKQNWKRLIVAWSYFDEKHLSNIHFSLASTNLSCHLAITISCHIWLTW